MSKRLTNYKNKVINEVNELYPNVVCRYTHEDKKIDLWGERITNKKSKLKNLKKLKDFVGDILKIEDIIIRRPVEDDIYIKRNIKKAPYCVYECFIVKSIKENKYYTLDINSLNSKDFEYITLTKEPVFYIYDITNKTYEIKNDENKDIEKDVDYDECYRLLINKEQKAVSFNDYDKGIYYYS